MSDPIAKLRARIEEEFRLVANLGGKADIKSAMLNVDALLDQLTAASEPAQSGGIVAGRDNWMPAAAPQPGAVVDAYEAGWRSAANWAKRDDLLADIGSPAYESDKAQALRRTVENKPAAADHTALIKELQGVHNNLGGLDTSWDKRVIREAIAALRDALGAKS